MPWDLMATLSFDAGQAYGSTGCNGFGATYELGRQKAIMFDRAGTNTDVGCADEQLAAQTAFMAALPKAVRWSIDTGTTIERSMVLRDADDRRLLAFTSDRTGLLVRQVRELTGLVEAQQAQIKSLRERIEELDWTS